MVDKNVHISQRKQWDAIVVGSGITGGWAAKELCENGLETLVLERGRDVKHAEDYITEHKPTYEFEFRGRGDRKEYEEQYPVQSKAGPFSEATKHWFVNDRKNPYTTGEDSEFRWVRGYHVGGRSIMWGRGCYRWSEMDFEANARDGFGVDWPVRYEEVEPWYEYVEEHVGIAGNNDGLPQLPDSVFIPPHEMNCAEQKVARGVEDAFKYRRIIHMRSATLTQNHKGRAACHYCGPCIRGCSTGSYFSSQSSTLPAARETGNMTLSPNSIVHSVIYDPETGKAAGVRVIDRETHETTEYHARIIFLCASALGSTQILLNSTSSRFPDGLGNSSGVLGHYLMDHPFRAGATGEIPGLEDKYYYGNRPVGINIARFRNINEETQHPDFLRGYQYSGGASRSGWGRGNSIEGFGEDLKNELRQPGPWRFGLTGFGECLPRYDNYVELNHDTTDAWGLPTLKIHASWSDNEENMRDDMAVAAAEMLEAGGATNVRTYKVDNVPMGTAIHEMGTARMGKDPDTSVLNKWNQVHDAPNVFVTDGACMTSSACQNPSLTYMMFTARAANHAVEEMKKGNL
jgi:choline dehydrogenase-like flavoprotein